MKSIFFLFLLISTNTVLAQWNQVGITHYYNPTNTDKIEAKFDTKYPEPSSNNPTRDEWKKKKSQYIYEQVISEMVLTAPEGVRVTGNITPVSGQGFRFSHKESNARPSLNTTSKSNSFKNTKLKNINMKTPNRTKTRKQSAQKVETPVETPIELNVENTQRDDRKYVQTEGQREPASNSSSPANQQCKQSDLTAIATDYQKTKKILEDLYKKELEDSGCEE